MTDNIIIFWAVLIQVGNFIITFTFKSALLETLNKVMVIRQFIYSVVFNYYLEEPHPFMYINIS